MVSTDVGRDHKFGTYRLAGLPSVDFDEFHVDELPTRLRRGANEQVAWDVDGRAPISIGLPDGRAYNYACRDGVVRIEPGVDESSETILEIVDEESWRDYLYEFRTRYGLLYSNAVRFVRGSFDTWDDWDPAIRCMYSGRQIYDPSDRNFLDRRGERLDLHQRFSMDDDPEEMSHFLRTTGYLVVRRAFSPALIAELASELDRLRDSAVEGELTSWWSRNGEGDRFPYRLTYLSDRSEVIGGLYAHPRVRELIALSKEDVVPVPDRIEGILAVLKEPGMSGGATGFANLPFHTDCGFGACHITCPCVLVGLQLDAANLDSSQIHFMAGSHGKAYHNRPDHITPERYPIVAVETEPGDATVHYGCGLHAGPEPTGSFRRRTLYVQHYNPRTFDLIGEYQGYNQIMPGYGEGEIPNIDEVQGITAEG
ncbi:phytanoyl-CoA dioxygenase family protein [Myxococcota bacterium]|nr:phytanoyl-CoA dioxygenase family protein [Myxococcota bacterium]